MAAAKAKYAKENPEKVRAARAAYDKANAAKIAKHKAAYYRANIEKMKARAAIKRAKNREKISASSAKYARANLDKRRAYTAKRHAARLRALPPWRGEWDVTKANEAIYEGAPQGMHVDHIVPLQGDAVCGLHVPWNLQILPPAENIRKGNRFDQDRFSAQYLSALRA